MATRSEWGRVSIAGVPPIAGHPIAGAEIKIKIKYFSFLPLIILSGVFVKFWGRIFFGGRSLFSAACYVLGTNFFAVHYLQRGVVLGREFF